MASCQTSRWVANSAPYVKLTVTQTSSTATSATLSWTLQYISDTPARAGTRDYTVKIAGSTVKTGTYNINGVTGTKTIASGTKTITKTHSTQTINFSVSFEFAITWSGVYAGTLSANGSTSVAKKTSYTVSYNANGGSGVPSSQTKWYGETLTLSSTKPTRSGYTFVGWGTSTTDTSADWSAGGSYTTNASDTLYAIWSKTITLSYNANGGSDAPSSQSATVYNATTSKTFTISSTKPTRTGYTFLGWSKSSSATSSSYASGGSITLSSSDTLYAVWKIKTYTVSYDANGGSNAPSSQTKTHGVDLKLSSSKPTRTGYNFLNWKSERSDGTVTFAPGNTTSYNGSQKLVAQWELKTYTVTYNANGGSNAPASQTKTYGTDLKLSSTKPTRTNYNFKGWATSSSSKTVSYSAGGTYKTNGSITLYAVWEVAYIKPRITSVAVTRCDADGNAQDDGTYAIVNFKWATDKDVSGINISWKASTSSTYSNSVSVTATGKSGSVRQVVGDGAFSVENAYNIKINVIDTTDSNYATKTLGATAFPIDLRKGGKGVTIGGPAKKDGFNVEMPTNINNTLKANNLGRVTFKSAEFVSSVEKAKSIVGNIYLLKPFNMAFIRLYVEGFTETIAASTSGFTLCTLGSDFRPYANAALNGHSTKDVNVLLNTTGNIRIVPRDGFATSNDLYISGLYPLSSSSTYYEE